ncbi:MAG: hypothetical protein IPL61_32345 [Myxococcales bacterium]|nr:hypothetical protein [Myxococcales bacterium]
MSSRVAALAALAVIACGAKGGGVDPTAARCQPHRTRELACADAETGKALMLVGDMCQKVLNGKNPGMFGARAVQRMEAELACATAHADCASYVACKDALDERAADD